MITIRMDLTQLSDQSRYAAAQRVGLPQEAIEEFQQGVLAAILLAAPPRPTVCWVHFHVTDGHECPHETTPGLCTAEVHYMAGIASSLAEHWGRRIKVRSAFRHASVIEGLTAVQQERFKTLVHWLPHAEAPGIEDRTRHGAEGT